MGIGLDAGEAIPVEGGYRGAALNLAAQLCGMAAAGEVLASAGVAHLARKTEGLVYLDRGEVIVESLGDVVRVVQVLPADAVADADARIIDVDRLRDPERRQARISALYRAAQAAMAVGNWAVALERLTDLLTLEPGHQEAAAHGREDVPHPLMAHEAPQDGLSINTT